MLSLKSVLQGLSYALLVVPSYCRRASPRDMLRRENPTLVPFTFTPFPLGTVKPNGWLNDQLQLMATGLAGNEMNFFPIVKNNRWLGGNTDYSDLNEALPYWFNGLVALAYGIDNTDLQTQVKDVANYVLTHQSSSGWLGPETNPNSNDLWARFPMCLGLKQLAEAEPSMTQQITDALYKFVPLMDSMLEDGQSDYEPWGRTRYADMNIVLQWLYEKHPNDNSSQLIETMNRWVQHGYDWADWYTVAKYPTADINTYPSSYADAGINGSAFPPTHGVNVGQGLKTMGVNYRFTADDSLIQVQQNAVNWTMQYHGAPSGTILGDERLAGLGPDHGSELCTTVETMYSLTYLYQLLGDASFADKAELAAFNALPAMMTPDHWAHQYLALPNQPFANEIPNYQGLFWNDDADSVTFGLEPNYPCCAVNHPQGWPKLLANTFSAATDGHGLAHTILAPASVNTTVGDGTKISISCDTNYPFTFDLQYTISASGPFNLYLRVPQWQTDIPGVTLNSKALPDSDLGVDNHGVLTLAIPAGSSSLTYSLSPSLRVMPRSNSTVAVYHGALLYALDLGQTTQRVAPTDPSTPSSASTIYYNSTQPWNLAIDTSTLKYVAPSLAAGASLPNPLWDYQAAPGWLEVSACPINWTASPANDWVPSPVPLPSPGGSTRACTGPKSTVTMRPYGSLRARMVELPLMGS